MKTSGYIVIAIGIIMLIFSSCKKKEQAETPPTPNGTFGLHLHTSVNGIEIDAGDTAADMQGRKIRVDIAQFYFSNVRLKKADGSEVTVGNVQLKTIGEEMYVIGQAPAGNYTGCSFQVGLDNSTNQTMPSSCPASSVLAPQNPSMWFGTCAQGYMFMNVQGYIDTTVARNGNVDRAFTLQLGTGSQLKTVSVAKDYSIVANQTYYIHAMADYGMLLDGVDFKSHSVITPFSDPAAAAHAADNIVHMFMFE